MRYERGNKRELVYVEAKGAVLVAARMRGRNSDFGARSCLRFRLKSGLEPTCRSCPPCQPPLAFDRGLETIHYPHSFPCFVSSFDPHLSHLRLRLSAPSQLAQIGLHVVLHQTCTVTISLPRSSVHCNIGKNEWTSRCSTPWIQLSYRRLDPRCGLFTHHDEPKGASGELLSLSPLMSANREAEHDCTTLPSRSVPNEASRVMHYSLHGRGTALHAKSSSGGFPEALKPIISFSIFVLAKNTVILLYQWKSIQISEIPEVWPKVPAKV